jgi:signal transduction histidine kinase
METLRRRRPQLSQIAAALYLAGLAMATLTAWQLPAGGSGPTGSAFGALHLILVLGIGSVLALATLARTGRADTEAAVSAHEASGDGLGELMAHISHQLRTPLNAVIGFAEMMARELHGPLGNSRYQEYARHICESGGRLLKSSEDALAVTEAMTSLMQERGRSERVEVGGLVRQAWAAVAGDAAPPLRLTGCEALTITCERRATVQALEYLLRHAIALPLAQAIEISARQDRFLGVDIRVKGAASGGSDTVDLHVIMARLLLNTQAATLASAWTASGWSASIGFAHAQARGRPQSSGRVNRQPTWSVDCARSPADRARPEGSGLMACAARARPDRCAAPPA